VPEPLLRTRPHKTRIASWIGAVVCVLAAVALSAALSGPVAGGPELFGPADRMATIGLGLIGALAVLALGRPLVEADRDRIRVRNILGGVELPWSVVRAIRFERGASCASLELHDDDVVAVQAIQAVDKERAVAAIQALRELHAAHGQQDQQTGPRR
jgi:hypothetical protein